MFDFLFRKKDGELASILEVINQDVAEMNASKFAIEKAVGMISRAIAKSEIILQDGDGRRKDKYYYALNIRPNDNETAAVFWDRAVRRLLIEGECLIVRVREKYYVADSWTEDQVIMRQKSYSNVAISLRGSNVILNKTFRSREVIYLQYENVKVKRYMEALVTKYDATLSRINKAVQLASTPKYKMSLDAATSFAEKQEDGSVKQLTKDQYVNKIRSILSSEELSIMTVSRGVDVSAISQTKLAEVNDLEKIEARQQEDAALAFDIPLAAYKGTITEKSDATNEFITYAVSPVAKIINDGLTEALIGMDDYCNGERVFVWLNKFKHVDIIDAAVNLDKLRSIGFTLDEIFELCGYPQLNTEFSTTRVVTKNYASEEPTTSNKDV